MLSHKEKMLAHAGLDSAQHLDADKALLASVKPSSVLLKRVYLSREKAERDVLWELLGLVSAETIRKNRRERDVDSSLPSDTAEPSEATSEELAPSNPADAVSEDPDATMDQGAPADTAESSGATSGEPAKPVTEKKSSKSKPVKGKSNGKSSPKRKSTPK
jgi:hypothetical protein